MTDGPGLLPGAIAFAVVTAAAWALIAWTDYLPYPQWMAPMFGALAFIVVRIVAGVLDALRR